MQTINLDGINYILINTREITGRPGRYELELRRVKGRRSYYAVKYENGVIGTVI